MVEEELDGGWSMIVDNLLEILTKRKGQAFYNRCPLCDKCCRREYFFNIHVEYCESVK